MLLSTIGNGRVGSNDGRDGLNGVSRMVGKLKRTAWVNCIGFVGVAAALLITQPARAGDPDLSIRGVFYSISVENDRFGNQDRRYTSGLKISTLRAEESLPKVLRRNLKRIPFFPEHGKKRFGLQLGQSMFTSDDISQTCPPQDERPYAGWLYTNIQVNSDTGARLDQFQVTLGVVGRYALADQFQKTVHKLFDAVEPRGWDTQLENEPGLMVSYQRKWHAERGFFDLNGLEIGFTPHLGGSLGNVYTHLAVGGIFRAGFNLPQDYGPPLISPSTAGTDFFVPSNRFGWYLFAGFEGRAVARNIFLDGNTFRSSRSVDKKYWVGELLGGVVLTVKRYRLAYTHVLRTKEYRGQKGNDMFGAITVTAGF